MTFPDGQVETWHLDAETFLEVAVDSKIYDFTQGGEPVPLRTFYEDFREVDGIVLPHQVYLEFGHRLESLAVSAVEVNPEVDSQIFSAPPPAEPEGTDPDES